MQAMATETKCVEFVVLSAIGTYQTCPSALQMSAHGAIADISLGSSTRNFLGGIFTPGMSDFIVPTLLRG